MYVIYADQLGWFWGVNVIIYASPSMGIIQLCILCLPYSIIEPSVNKNITIFEHPITSKSHRQ